MSTQIIDLSKLSALELAEVIASASDRKQALLKEQEQKNLDNVVDNRKKATTAALQPILNQILEAIKHGYESHSISIKYTERGDGCINGKIIVDSKNTITVNHSTLYRCSDSNPSTSWTMERHFDANFPISSRKTTYKNVKSLIKGILEELNILKEIENVRQEKKKAKLLEQQAFESAFGNSLAPFRYTLHDGTERTHCVVIDKMIRDDNNVAFSAMLQINSQLSVDTINKVLEILATDKYIMAGTTFGKKVLTSETK